VQVLWCIGIANWVDLLCRRIVRDDRRGEVPIMARLHRMRKAERRDGHEQGDPNDGPARA